MLEDQIEPVCTIAQRSEICRLWVSVASATYIVSAFSVVAAAGGNEQLIFGGYTHSWKEGQTT
jgi:hypothetical protein